MSRALLFCCLLVCVAVARLAAVAASVSEYQACQPPHDSYPFCDTTLSRAERLSDLLSRLTLDEQISQLGNNARNISRLGIPRYEWWSEALHGLNSQCSRDGRCATSFPCGLNLGASFDSPLVERIGRAIADEVRGAFNDGVHYINGDHVDTPVSLDMWSPNVNIFRDPRWGRGQETPGEDPYLSSRYGAAMVRGLQYSDGASVLKVLATPKHFVAYSLENYTGVDRFHFSANVSARDLAQTFYPAFRAAVRDGGALGMMCSYNEVNGVPSCASAPLLAELLRGEWGFQGYVTGDCDAVYAISETHHYVADAVHGAAAALNAGTDVDCRWDYPEFQPHLAAAVAQNLTTAAHVATAVSRLLDLRLRLGLFDPAASLPWAALTADELGAPDHVALARSAARESLVLLLNRGAVLPLTKPASASAATSQRARAHTRASRAGAGAGAGAGAAAPLKVALVGPSVLTADGTALCSNYHGQLPAVPSLLSALQAESGVEVLYAAALGNVSDSSEAGFAAAQSAISGSDVAVLVLGIDQSIESEGHDRTTTALPGAQLALLRAARAAADWRLGRPLIVVTIHGGMINMEEIVEVADAILDAFYPGQEGAAAIWDALFGRVVPSGRLPYTVYANDFVEEMDFFSYDMRQFPGKTYRFHEQQPVFPFGFGLSYSHFSFRALSQSAQWSPVSPTPITFVAQVTNDGPLPADLTVLSFIRLMAGHEDCPRRQLAAFERVAALAVGQSANVTVQLDASAAMCVDVKGRATTKMGLYQVTVGEAEFSFEVRGPVAGHRRRHH